MPIELKMPALSPTMEEGTLAKWLVKAGDAVRSGDILAEIETDKATMEFEAVDEGTIVAIAVPEGSEGVKVGTVIATLAGEGEPVVPVDTVTSAPVPQTPAASAQPPAIPAMKEPEPAPVPVPVAVTLADRGNRIAASPLARRIAVQAGIDLASLAGSGPGGRIVKADVIATGAPGVAARPAAGSTPLAPSAISTTSAPVPDFGIPFEDEKLGNVRKVIARRLTEAKQTIPHIYLTVDVRLDALLKLRGELNATLAGEGAGEGVKLSVNDLMIKALARALERVPQCNVAFGGDVLRRYSRVDVSVAVAAPSGLITPIVTDAGGKSISAISKEMAALADKAREGKLQPHEYQGGTASLSNLGMYGIRQFDAVINPPQAMILAVGAGEKRPHVIDDALCVATVMSATGSFDHRAIDGADAALLMQAFRDLVEQPMTMLA